LNRRNFSLGNAVEQMIQQPGWKIVTADLRHGYSP
jgi:hypothetical protein